MIVFETLGDHYNGIKEQTHEIWDSLGRQNIAQIVSEVMGINVLCQ